MPDVVYSGMNESNQRLFVYILALHNLLILVILLA